MDRDSRMLGIGQEHQRAKDPAWVPFVKAVACFSITSQFSASVRMSTKARRLTRFLGIYVPVVSNTYKCVSGAARAAGRNLCRIHFVWYFAYFWVARFIDSTPVENAASEGEE